MDRFAIAIDTYGVMGTLADIDAQKDQRSVITGHQQPPVLARCSNQRCSARITLRAPLWLVPYLAMTGHRARTGATHPRSLTTGACQPYRARPVRWPQPTYRPGPRTRR